MGNSAWIPFSPELREDCLSSFLLSLLTSDFFLGKSSWVISCSKMANSMLVWGALEHSRGIGSALRDVSIMSMVLSMPKLPAVIDGCGQL